MSKTSEITIPNPLWGSNLAGIILDLEKLRSKKLYGEVPPHVFFQLKDVFQILETLGSARIEGNNTTLAEYVEKVIEETQQTDESQKQLRNLDEAIKWIEENTDEDTEFTRAYIAEIHKIITKELTPPQGGEGSRFPGELRPHNVKIGKHNPPDASILQDYFDEFLKFINFPFAEQYQLLMVAIAHHRFAYIHPFDNGNGRMGRLLNYALLIKLGFKVKNGRIINPSSVFYADRSNYYTQLSQADSLEDDKILGWTEYFLGGLKNEIEKIDSLLSKKYVREEILFPALSFALEREHITEKEYSILKYLVSKDDMTMKSEELEEVGITGGSVQKARIMAKLREKKMIRPVKENGRIYTVHFVNNYLLRSIIKSLEKKGFISDFLNSDKNK